jgi:hypothetical protein
VPLYRPTRNRQMSRIGAGSWHPAKTVGTVSPGVLPVPVLCRQCGYRRRCRQVPTGTNMYRPGLSGPGAARRGTPRAARLCRYQICSFWILRRSSANRSLFKSTSYHKPVKMQFDHCNIAKKATLSLSLTASAYANVQSNQKVVDDS